jgi:hypothetical protein
MRSSRICAVAAVVFILVACTRASSRGDGCRNDSDCAADLRCMQTAQNTAICTTTCTAGVTESCPKGWKCIELDHFT